LAAPPRGYHTRAEPPRPELETAGEPERPDDAAYARRYWQNLDSLFNRTLGYAESAFKTNRYINLIVVGVGISILAYAIVYSALKSLDLYSTAFGTLGVVSFVALFYFTPQKKIQKTVGDLAQIQMFYRTYWSQVEAVLDWVRDNRRGMTFEQLEKVNTQLQGVTKYATEQVEALIGKD